MYTLEDIQAVDPEIAAAITAEFDRQNSHIELIASENWVSHYDYVCNEVSKGVAAVSLESEIPVMFGVVTTENIEQAIERAGTKAGNKGYDCALGAVEMVNLIRQI